MQVKNWILKKHVDNIQIISDDYLPFYRNYLENKGVIVNQDFSKASYFINWNLYSKNFDFFYDYEGCEKEIENLLFRSEISKTKKISMDFGYNNPVILIETPYFINNWYDFIIGANNESTIVSEDGSCIMEFTRRYVLNSNFLIK